jgi:hypothetical protein
MIRKQDGRFRRLLSNLRRVVSKKEIADHSLQPNPKKEQNHMSQVARGKACYTLLAISIICAALQVHAQQYNITDLNSPREQTAEATVQLGDLNSFKPSNYTNRLEQRSRLDFRSDNQPTLP